jgi:hypothetical protein
MAKQTFTTGQVLTAAQMTSLQETAMGGGSPSTKTASYVLVAADAGTVIQMNAAGSTTITVNTSLFSAGDSVQIQNIGTGTCTITPGTATVNTAGSLALSQWEGGFLYFTSASSAIFFDVVQSSGMTNPMTTTGDTIYSSSGSTPARLGIGSTGQVLTVAGGVPSWATPAGGGKVLQVLWAEYSTATTIATTTYTDTGISLAITPSSTSSKVLVIVNNSGRIASSTNIGVSSRILRGATTIFQQEAADYLAWFIAEGAGTELSFIDTMVYLDSPATTSATTYKTQSGTRGSQTAIWQRGSKKSTILLMEIGA